jgi:hypothetical protein
MTDRGNEPQRDRFVEILEIITSDTVVKAVFDHVRNLLITAGVFGSGFWLMSNAYPAISVSDRIVRTALISLVFLLGTALFFLNQFHLVAQLRRAGALVRVVQYSLYLYDIVALAIIASVIAR